MLCKNGNYSLWDSIFCSKLCKLTHVSDCLLLSLEQLLALIPRYISFIYCIDNGFKILLRRVNFIIALNQSLYVFLILIAFMTGIVSIIQRVSLGVLIHNPYLRKWSFGVCLRVESGSDKLYSTDVTGHRHASSRFISSLNIQKQPPEVFFKKMCF